jgi:hypothetical protein
MKRKLNNYYLTIKTKTDIYDFSQDAFNLYYFTKTNQDSLNEILNDTYSKYITEEGIEIYITQEPNSNDDSNKKNEIVRLLRNLPKYTLIVNKKETNKIIYQLQKYETI